MDGVGRFLSVRAPSRRGVDRGRDRRGRGADISVAIGGVLVVAGTYVGALARPAPLETPVEATA